MKKLKSRFSARVLLSLLLLIGINSFFFNCRKTPTEPEISTIGEIRVESSPTGAKVYLDGLDTGRTTNCILPDITSGSHIIKLVLDGYIDMEQNVTVTGGGTTPVNINFVGHTITILEPHGESFVIMGEEAEIRWQTDTNAILSGNFGIINAPTQSFEDANTTGDVRLSTLTNVRIELFKGATQERTLVSNTENDGIYIWGVPSNLRMASNYRVRIACVSDPNIYSTSDNFSIEFPHKSYTWGSFQNPLGYSLSGNPNIWTTIKVNINDVGIIKKVEFYVSTFSMEFTGFSGYLEHNNIQCNFSGTFYGGGKETLLFNGLQMQGDWIFKLHSNGTDGASTWGQVDSIEITIWY